uniref:hypothetical protein n=1 Tax=Metasolibacillus meyeri TaxID=1071052 RepID=UPI003B75B542
LHALEQRMDKKLHALEQRVDEKWHTLEQKIDERIQALEQKIDEKIQSLEDRIQENFIATGEQFEYMTKVMQEKNEEIDKQFNFHSLKIMQLERDLKFHMLAH